MDCTEDEQVHQRSIELLVLDCTALTKRPTLYPNKKDVGVKGMTSLIFP